MRAYWRFPAVCMLAGAALGCGGADAPPADRAAESVSPARQGTLARDAADTLASAAAVVPGTPPGGLYQWVSEIRSGISLLPAEAARDVAAAQRRALELYTTRQEYLEKYWGPRGRLISGGALGSAVEKAEHEFHDLMQLLVAAPAPDTGRVHLAVASLDAALQRVIEAAEAAGVPLVGGPADSGAKPQ